MNSSSSQDKSELNKTVPHDHKQQIKNENKQARERDQSQHMQKKKDAVVGTEINKQEPAEEEKKELQPRDRLIKISEQSEE